jgi:putative mRNA 3-end processing factor
MGANKTPTPSRLDVEYLGGIHLVDSILWMDALRRVDLCFLSHAHAAKSLAHAKILATDATIRLSTGAPFRAKTLISPYYRRFSLGELDLELHPAGHTLGSAQLLINADRRRLVYTGHFDLSPNRSIEPARILDCDVLVMDVDGCQPGLTRPEPEPEAAAVVAWIKRVLAAGAQPVLLADPLGPAQELAALIGAAGLTTRVHRSIYTVCRTYHDLGNKLPGVRSFRGTPRRDEVTIFPPHLARSRAIEKLTRRRLALANPFETSPGEFSLPRFDARFDFSCSADHNHVLRYALESNARRIYVLGRNATAIADDLRTRGHRAWPLIPPHQMDIFRGAKRPASS